MCRNDSVIFTTQVNKKVCFIQEFQFSTRNRSVEREIAVNSPRMKKTHVLIALGAFLLLTMLIAESESIGNLTPAGKRQLHEKVCIHQTAVFLISRFESTQHLLRTRGRTWIIKRIRALVPNLRCATTAQVSAQYRD